MTLVTTPWERVAASEWGAYISEREEQMIRRASELAGGPAYALEIGCEGGRWARMLSELGWSMVCTDVDEGALSLCEERLPEARCVRVDPSDEVLPVEDDSLALVVCIEVLPVVSSAWFLDEVERVLAPGGVLVANVWNRRSVRGILAVLAARWRGEGRHRFYRCSYGSWRRRCRAAGFDIRSERGLCWFPFGRASDSSLVGVAAFLEDSLALSRLPSLSPWVIVVARCSNAL